MAWQLAKIKLKSQWASLRAQTAMLVFGIIGYVWLLGLVVSLSLGMIFGRAAGLPLVPELSVAAGGLYTLGWVVLPIIFASQDATLDPTKLAPFLSPNRKLAWALLLASGVGAAGVYLAIFTLAYATSWWVDSGVAAGLTATLGGLLGIFIAFVWSRATVAYSSRYQMGRRGKERAGLIALVVILVMSVSVTTLANTSALDLGPAGVTGLATATTILKWTPFGAPWALPAAVSAGAYGQATLLGVISITAAWVGWWLWVRLLPSAMAGIPSKLSVSSLELIEAGETRLPSRGHHSRSAGTPPSGGTPISAGTSIPFLRATQPMMRLGLNGPTAATAQRTWLYWIRDPRLSAQLISIVFLLILAVVMPKFLMDDVGLGGTNFFALGIGGMAAFLTGTTIGTLVQYDSTALWPQVSAGTRGWEDRLGRLVGSGPVVVVLLGGGTALFAILGLNLGRMFALFTFMVVIFTGAFTATQILSAFWIYQVQPPGSSPLSTKQTGQFWSTMLLGLVQFVFSGALVLPAAIALLFGVVLVPGGWHTPGALAVSWVYSAVLIAAGTYVSGRILDATQVDLLTRMANWPGHRIQA